MNKIFPFNEEYKTYFVLWLLKFSSYPFRARTVSTILIFIKWLTKIIFPSRLKKDSNKNFEYSFQAKYIKLSGFGGAVAWTIDLDDFSNTCCEGTFPLLTTLNRELGLIPNRPPQKDCTQPLPPSTPLPPITTTGVDTGAEYTTAHNHEDHYTTSKKPVTWWSTTMKPATQQTTIESTTSWWQTSKITQPWWSSTSSSTSGTTSTRRTTTSTTTESVSTSTTLPNPAIVMPNVDHPGMTCQAGQYIPDSANCNAYYRCILGELKRQYCVGGLHWNREKGICDWPTSARCEELGEFFPHLPQFVCDRT